MFFIPLQILPALRSSSINSPTRVLINWARGNTNFLIVLDRWNSVTRRALLKEKYSPCFIYVSIAASLSVKSRLKIVVLRDSSNGRKKGRRENRPWVPDGIDFSPMERRTWPEVARNPFDVHVHSPRALSLSLSLSLSLVPLWIFVRPTVLVRNVRQVKRSTHNRRGLNAGNYICRRVSNGWWSWSLPCWGSYCCGSLSVYGLAWLEI